MILNRILKTLYDFYGLERVIKGLQLIVDEDVRSGDAPILGNPLPGLLPRSHRS